MTKKGRNIILVVLFAILILVFTNPNEADYEQWLAEEHGIHYTSSPEMGREYVMSTNGVDQKIEYRGGHIQHAGIYTFYDNRYTDADGNDINIKAFGILKMLFDRS
ncbi:hypothetical protein ASD24_09700 [Paenibacillus sp. Root52]|uniref:hypothetical protein n=1 Tax=Paenibacillus sp. Root52 TaxID=1736552 RepID=UPI0006F52656|nr:hypothetical protein [Paenibacillus sp. Root52]KQY84058.1 hypothetical protein ASD24_09700 [Paenibacillus sp. Root52]